MVLTPEDVIAKTFQPTRFQAGYSEEDVDDFLDEVVETLRTLHGENEELRTALASRQARVAEPAASGSNPRVSEPGTAPEDSVAPAAAAGEVGAAASTDSPEDASGSAARILALAQRLHDEHIAAGQRQRDELIAQARERVDALVGEAEQVRDETLNSLELERDQLQTWIDSLRDFEHAYRSRLKSFLQAQLADLQTQTTLEPQHSVT